MAMVKDYVPWSVREDWIEKYCTGLCGMEQIRHLFEKDKVYSAYFVRPLDPDNPDDPAVHEMLSVQRSTDDESIYYINGLVNYPIHEFYGNDWWDMTRVLTVERWREVLFNASMNAMRDAEKTLFHDQDEDAFRNLMAVSNQLYLLWAVYTVNRYNILNALRRLHELPPETQALDNLKEIVKIEDDEEFTQSIRDYIVDDDFFRRLKPHNGNLGW